MMSKLLTVYFDASCGLCRHEMGAIQQHDVAQRLTLVDCSAADFDDTPFRAEGVTRAAMMASLHLRDAAGAWITGVDAFAVLHRTVGMTGIARLWGGKLTRPVMLRLYPLVARHRQLLSWTGLPLVFVVWEKYAAWQAERRSQSCRDGACSFPPLAHSWERGLGEKEYTRKSKTSPSP
ncbi:MAG: DUF393 domain-containing protein [Gallionella sp.]|nr:DUF393 domain-containing protein [Gallionella sp.]